MRSLPFVLLVLLTILCLRNSPHWASTSLYSLNLGGEGKSIFMLPCHVSNSRFPPPPLPLSSGESRHLPFLFRWKSRPSSSPFSHPLPFLLPCCSCSCSSCSSSLFLFVLLCSFFVFLLHPRATHSLSHHISLFSIKNEVSKVSYVAAFVCG